MTGALTRSADERSYATSEVGGVAERRYPVSEVRGGDERSYLCQRSGAVAGRRYPKPPRLRPGAAAGRTNPMPWLHGHRRA